MTPIGATSTPLIQRGKPEGQYHETKYRSPLTSAMACELGEGELRGLRRLSSFGKSSVSSGLDRDQSSSLSSYTQ